jgi:hypothetical protein
MVRFPFKSHADAQKFWRPKPKATTESSSGTTVPAAGSASQPEQSLGLKVLTEPRTAQSASSKKTVSIIFVHGLGGSSKETWSHEVSKTFWPTLLREEDNLENLRVSTFGYDANFTNVLAPKNALGIADFAKQLLDALDLHYHRYGDV